MKWWIFKESIADVYIAGTQAFEKLDFILLNKHSVNILVVLCFK
jgi:hypothetical protein